MAAPMPSAVAALPTDERELRIQLAGVYRLFNSLGWTELIYNHITVRIPGTDHFLINPFGLHYSEVTASSLVRIDIDGRVVTPTAHRVNPAGFAIHSVIHRRVPDAHCVMHVHTTAGAAVSCMPDGLETSNFYAAQLHDSIAYHDFEGIVLTPDEGERIVASMGSRPLLILRHHGLLSIGHTLAHAFVRLWTLNRACEMQCLTHAMGRPLPIAPGIARKTTAEALQFDPRYGAGQDTLDALLRQLDRSDPGYRD